MCRMTIYKGLGLDQSILLSDLIVNPKHSIITQSFNCQERFHDTGLPPQLNADGFGIGWYAEKLYDTETKRSSKLAAAAAVRSPDVKRRRKTTSNGANSDVNSHRVNNHSTEISAAKSAQEGIVKDRNKQYETPCVFTSISPAWNNRNLRQLAEKVSSPLFFAHVRAASPGSSTTEANCHPFTFDKYLWMHNGGISNFHLVKRMILSKLSNVSFNMMGGNTDSEHCFALFLTKLEEMSPLETEFSATQLRHAMISTIREINECCRKAGIQDASLLNFAVTDGDNVVACRYASVSTAKAASLYFTSGSRWVQSKERPKEYIMKRLDKNEKVFVLASERLSNEPGDWLEVPKNHVVIVTAEMNIHICPIRDTIDFPDKIPSNPNEAPLDCI